MTTRVNLAAAPIVGTGVLIGRRTQIVGNARGQLVLGDSVWVGDDCEIGILESVRIGPGVSLQHRTQLHGDVEIGAGCVCAANLYIASTSHRFRDFPYLPIRWQDVLVQEQSMRSRPVVVEEDCWIGINVVICPGVVVGRGTVVGANSVVTANTPPYSVVAGAPARIVGQRLTFVPPVKLLAQRPEDAPYFYAGFVTPEKTRESWSLAVGKGLWVQKHFALALQSRASDFLCLQVVATSLVKLVHGDQEICVLEGQSEVVISAQPDTRGLLWFSVSDWTSHCMAIQAAWVGDDTVQLESRS